MAGLVSGLVAARPVFGSVALSAAAGLLDVVGAGVVAVGGVWAGWRRLAPGRGLHIIAKRRAGVEFVTPGGIPSRLGRIWLSGALERSLAPARSAAASLIFLVLLWVGHLGWHGALLAAVYGRGEGAFGALGRGHLLLSRGAIGVISRRGESKGLFFGLFFVVGRELFPHSPPTIADDLVLPLREAASRDQFWIPSILLGIVNGPGVDNLLKTRSLPVRIRHELGEHPGLEPAGGEGGDAGLLVRCRWHVKVLAVQGTVD